MINNCIFVVVDVLGVEVIISVDMCALVSDAVGVDVVMCANMDSLTPLLWMLAITSVVDARNNKTAAGKGEGGGLSVQAAN